jgi:serine/threonine protein phosphatase PrpC
MDNWALKNRIADLQQQILRIPNAMVGKAYRASVDPAEWAATDVIYLECQGLADTGLQYDADLQEINGVPHTAGDLEINLAFRLDTENQDNPLNVKKITLVINADPKSLWKDLPSDQNDRYWKPDAVAGKTGLAGKQLVFGSVRGRAHANAGGFREDDVAYHTFENLDWHLIAVADGAGSSSLSRKASQLVCNGVIDYFKHNFSKADADLLSSYGLHILSDPGAPEAGLLQKFTHNLFRNAVSSLCQQLEEQASAEGLNVSDFYTTLSFVLLKKLDAGHLLLSFGVGDSPIVLIDAGRTSAHLLNTLDAGVYSGATRFVSPEILENEQFNGRCQVSLLKDFSFLFLLTDGIYDPKFEVEMNLEKMDKWALFLQDLQGKNEQAAALDFSDDQGNMSDQLLSWMKFWSQGNHDDRTLVILY